MKPRRGWLYRLDEAEEARATAALVLSEDDWNRATEDSVVVPLYDDEPTVANPIAPRIGELWADCSLVGGIPQAFLVEEMAPADDAALKAVCDGVRLYLDLDTLLNPPRLRRAPSAGRSDWWPQRGEVYYGHRFGDQRERYGVITDDEWNVRNDYATCAFITSRFKNWRKRWQIPLTTGGFAIPPDIEPFEYPALEQRARPPAGEQRLTSADLTAFANGLILALEL